MIRKNTKESPKTWPSLFICWIKFGNRIHTFTMEKMHTFTPSLIQTNLSELLLTEWFFTLRDSPSRPVAPCDWKSFQWTLSAVHLKLALVSTFIFHPRYLFNRRDISSIHTLAKSLFAIDLATRSPWTHIHTHTPWPPCNCDDNNDKNNKTAKSTAEILLHYFAQPMGSFVTVGYTNKDVVYKWNPNRKVVIASDMKMSQFDLISAPTGNETGDLKKGKLIRKRRWTNSGAIRRIK